jgi:hypothetical protein
MFLGEKKNPGFRDFALCRSTEKKNRSITAIKK